MAPQSPARHNPPWISQQNRPQHSSGSVTAPGLKKSALSPKQGPQASPSEHTVGTSAGASSIAGWHQRRASETAHSIDRDWNLDLEREPQNSAGALLAASPRIGERRWSTISGMSRNSDFRPSRAWSATENELQESNLDASSGATMVSPVNSEVPQIDLLKAMDLDKPWECTLDPDVHGIAGARAPESRMVRMRKFLWATVRTNPFFPFTIRGLALAFSLVGLGLAARIYRLSLDSVLKQTASTIMAIVVLTIASVYLTYSIYDEFFGKPLGLRSPGMKMTFIMCDLVLILFNSANVSLAYNALIDDHWACSMTETLELCHRQKDLVGLMTAALTMWVATAAVSLYRVVDRNS